MQELKKAVVSCNFERINNLLSKPDLEINYEFSEGQYKCSLLFYPVNANNPTIVRELLNYPGIDVNFPPTDPDLITSDPPNPLRVAIKLGYFEIIRLLLDRTDIDLTGALYLPSGERLKILFSHPNIQNFEFDEFDKLIDQTDSIIKYLSMPLQTEKNLLREYKLSDVIKKKELLNSYINSPHTVRIDSMREFYPNYVVDYYVLLVLFTDGYLGMKNNLDQEKFGQTTRFFTIGQSLSDELQFILASRMLRFEFYNIKKSQHALIDETVRKIFLRFERS
jgi:hypothetical protein